MAKVVQSNVFLYPAYLPHVPLRMSATPFPKFFNFEAKYVWGFVHRLTIWLFLFFFVSQFDCIRFTAIFREISEKKNICHLQ